MYKFLIAIIDWKKWAGRAALRNDDIDLLRNGQAGQH
jgi:hypothetical protein